MGEGLKRAFAAAKASRRRDPLDRLYRAVAAWVKANGGSAVVLGGVEVQKWPDDSALAYRIAIKCTGTAPLKARE